jgi:hypothetical protein
MSEVIGKIIVIGNEEIVGSAGTFKKRLLVVETDEQYKQKITIDFVQDKCSLLDNYAVGNDVKVGINIRGNEYNSKYYVSLNGWRIEKLASEQAPPMPVATDFNPNSEENEPPF